IAASEPSEIGARRLSKVSGTGYLKSACDYVHLNPVRAALVAPDQPLESYRWSSYPLYLMSPERRPGWLRTDRLWASGASRQTLRPAESSSRATWKPAARPNRMASLLPRGWCLLTGSVAHIDRWFGPGSKSLDINRVWFIVGPW